MLKKHFLTKKICFFCPKLILLVYRQKKSCASDDTGRPLRSLAPKETPQLPTSDNGFNGLNSYGTMVSIIDSFR